MLTYYGVEAVQGAGTGPTLYVATTGKDTAAGTQDAPLQTLAAAVAKVKPGGTIVMRAGQYAGAVVNTGFGTEQAWVTLKAAAGEKVILQGNPRGTQYPTLYFYESSCDEYAPAGSVCKSAYWRIEGLTLRAVATGGADSNALKVDMPHVQVANSVLCCAVPDVVKIVRTANDVAIVNSEIYADASLVKPGSNSQGVDITGADRVRIIGNHFHDLPDIAVYAKGNARNPVFAANRIENTGFGSATEGYNAIMLGQQTDENRLVDGPYESYDGLVVNNVISNVSGACLAASSSQNSRFLHNSCYRTALKIHSAMLVSTEGGLGPTPNQGVQFVNNLFSQEAAHPRILNSTDQEYTRPTQGPLVFASNIYWAGGQAPSFVWRPDFYNEKLFADWLGSFKKNYNGTDTSLLVDPRIDAALRPQSGSPAIGAGVDMQVRYDFNGKLRTTQPTIGAIEP
jgi:Right handed beta helix region/Protein of unknown function (DUF1565)